MKLTFELQCLAWTLVLALVQIMAAAQARTAQYGLKWNAGARDEAPAPLKPLPARLARAQSNLFETLPLFAAAVLIVAVADRYSGLSHWGALLYLVARIVYVPLYAFGVPYVRSLVWLVSLLALVMVIIAALI
ncbi:MAPEG family protein [Chitinasiproducens palmae]|uniref:Uncharacterized conserved protein, MAPEG superfamily n=1 Tax=Chitinasiproducens palmae TaxID=1770053 RepID=A0A1H2PP80_9BURK|nr:MAPEG family protein [Chitinasiproducens palmae]SDV48068.1 Uncharacterized conserved protein, MAPEG superfamily [Chitinasiproducens palmae]